MRWFNLTWLECTKLDLFHLRCRVLYKKTTCFSNFTKRGRIFFFYFFAIIPAIPMYFLYYLTKQDNSWYLAFSQNTHTDLGKIYVIGSLLIESVIPTVLLILFSFIAKAKFNKLIRKNQELGLASNPDKLKRDEIQFSRIIMITMILFSSIRFIDMAINLSMRINTFFHIFSCKSDAILFLMRQLAYLMLFVFHAFNTLIYYAMDSKLKEILPKRKELTSKLASIFRIQMN